MAVISSEQLHQAGQIQSLLWQSAAAAASEAANTLIICNDPIVELVDAADVKAMAGRTQIVISFALANLPDSRHTILIDPEVWSTFLNSLEDPTMTSTAATAIDVSRPILQAILQGLVSGLNNHLSEKTSSFDVTIENVPFLPADLDDDSKMVRISVPMFCGPSLVEAIWFFEPVSLVAMLGPVEEEGHAPAELRIASRPEPQLVTDSIITSRIGDDPSLALLMDIPLEVSVELGRVKMLVRDIVELGAGSIVEIEKAAGEPVDILVNRRLVARGEVVVIEDNFGVRITEILNPRERIAKLHEAA
jgi:flagellar motor switch protein FliN/FliY